MDEELDRVRGEIRALDEDGSNRRLLASTADNADVRKHGPTAGYISNVRSPRPRVRGGSLAISISCPAGGRACRGKLVVRAGRRTIARGRYRVPAGRTKVVSAPLTGAGRSRAKRRGALRATVELRSASGNRSGRTVTVH